MGKIKDHLKRNKKLYFGLGIGVVIGGVGVYVGTTKIRVNVTEEAQSSLNYTDVKPLVNVNSPITVNNITELVRRGHPGNVIKCLETGEVFASQNRASELLGINKDNLSKHLRGLRDDIGGLHFELVGDAGELLDAKKS